MLGSLHLGKDADTPRNLLAHMVHKTSRRSQGGQNSLDLASFQKGAYWDDAKGGWLDNELVQAARKEEMEYVRKHGVYIRVPRWMCFAEQVKHPSKPGGLIRTKGRPRTPTFVPGG